MGLLENRLSATDVDHVRQIILFSAAAHVRETTFKEGAQWHVNDANNDLEDLTVFEPTAANVSAFVGHTAYLPCRVRNLGDKVVSLFLFYLFFSIIQQQMTIKHEFFLNCRLNEIYTKSNSHTHVRIKSLKSLLHRDTSYFDKNCMCIYIIIILHEFHSLCVIVRI